MRSLLGLFHRNVFVIFVVVLAMYGLCTSQQSGKSDSVQLPTDSGELAPHKIFPLSKIQEKVIGEITAGSKVAGARTTENHLAWGEKAKDGSHIVRLDGKQVGAAYDEATNLGFSADQEHLIWTAKRGSKWLVVVDGQAGAEYDVLGRGSPVFDPDGNLEYLAVKEGSLYRIKSPRAP